MEQNRPNSVKRDHLRRILTCTGVLSTACLPVCGLRAGVGIANYKSINLALI